MSGLTSALAFGNAATSGFTRPRSTASNPVNKTLFQSPAPAGRQITAGFSYLQRIGKSASVDVWFPDILRRELDQLLSAGGALGPEVFPAEWAAVRQFELLQDAGNYKIYDLDPTHLWRSMRDLSQHMRAGGYRVTVVTVGGYTEEDAHDELEILDRRLQDRISRLINMLYLEEQSQAANSAMDQALEEEKWDYQSMLPHVGITLGSRDLFRREEKLTPGQGSRIKNERHIIPSLSQTVAVNQAPLWTADCGVIDAMSGEGFVHVAANPGIGEYSVEKGLYSFAACDGGRKVAICYDYSAATSGKVSPGARKHKLAQHFFDIVSLLPQKHILHDVAVGLQLPEQTAEGEWIYIAREGEKLHDFNLLMADLFTPFDKYSLHDLQGREGSKREIKSTVQHLRGYGDRLTPDADGFLRDLSRSLHQQIAFGCG